MSISNAEMYATFVCFALIYSRVCALSVTNTSPITVPEGTTGDVFNITATSTNTITGYTLYDPTATLYVANAASGVVSLRSNKELDYESKKQYVVTARASDGTSTATTTLTINLSDVNDEEPFYMHDTYRVCRYHSVMSPGETAKVGIYKATDLDGTSPNNAIDYSITSGDTAKFRYDSNGQLDAMHNAGHRVYTFVLKATDRGSPARSGTTSVTYTLTTSAACNSAALISGTLVAMTNAYLLVSLRLL